ncbi:MAG: hypothetical protein ACJ71X_02540, partial [Nitrososphaeraceae archaeon]
NNNNNMPSNNAAGGGMGGKSTASITGRGGMKSEANSNQMTMMHDMAKMQSMIIGGSLLSHIVYGAVLGVVVTVLMVKTAGTARKDLMTN